MALHSKRKKAKSAASKKGRNRAAELLQGFVVARAHVACTLTPHPEPWRLAPTRSLALLPNRQPLTPKRYP